MNLYITYDRYEHDEWFYIYGYGTNRNLEIKKCKEEYLPDFFSGGPDDCHSFQLQRVEVTPTMYRNFVRWNEEDQSLEKHGGDRDSELFKFMERAYDLSGMGVGSNPDVIICSGGCDDIFDIVRFYGNKKGLTDEEVEECMDELQDEVFNDDELFMKTAKEYIRKYY